MKRAITERKDLKGKRVLVRSDFNVDIDEKGKIIDATRIERALPTYEYLVSQGAIIIAMTHLGRPEGKVDPSLSTKPIAEELSRLLGKPVFHLDSVIGNDVEAKLASAEPGSIFLLENIRFYPEEQKKDPDFSKKLASLGEVFVADGFGVAHRDDASVTGVAEHLPTYAGLLMLDEMEHLDRFRKDPPRPLVLVIGGAKLVDKIKLIHKFISHADHILVGGALFASFFAANKRSVGATKVEDEVLGDALEAIHESLQYKQRLVLPIDMVVAKDGDAEPRTIHLTEIQKNDTIYDIGPGTEEHFQSIIAHAKSIVLNGAMGLFEKTAFAHGTEAVFRAIADAKAETVAGGGETIMALDQWQLTSNIHFISTGGGAMLSYLDGSPMPGIDVIPNNEENHEK